MSQTSQNNSNSPSPRGGGGIRSSENQDEDNVILYENEKENARNIIRECIESGARWCSLLAQMQSGKTMSYYLAISEAIREDKVEKGLIFCGSADKELKQQTEEKKDEFLDKYYNYLVDEILMHHKNAQKLCKKLKTLIRIAWSSDLKKIDPDKYRKNTFFVWEEAHFAQDKGMRTGEFLRTLGIDPRGNKEQLAALGSYMLTVSATSFSEITANEQQGQDKVIIKAKTGSSYYGLKKMIEANKICSFGQDLKEGLKMALKFHFNPEKPSYAFVRITSGIEIEEVKAIAKEMKWKTVQYDSKNKEIQLSDDDENCIASVLKRAPHKHTLIILKQFFRMGKNICSKKHISFVMEMARDSTADVVLQGLLGRMCGYEEHNVIVWLHENIIEQEFVIDYSNFMTNHSTQLPSKCRNLSTDTKASTELHAIIPVKVLVVDASTMSQSDLKTAIINCFERGEVDDLNQEEQSMEIRAQVQDRNTVIAFKFLKSDNETYKQVPEKIATSRREQEPVNLGSGSGIKAGTQLDEIHHVTAWIAHEDHEGSGIKCGDVFLDARTKCGGRIKERKTTGKEVFSGLGEEPLVVAQVVQMWEKTTTTKQLLLKTTTSKGTVVKKIGKPRKKVKLVLIQG